MAGWRPRIYFAASIAGGREDTSTYAEVFRTLSGFAEVLPNEVSSFEIGVDGEQSGAKEIHERELALLERSDALVAEVTVTSFGVGYQIAKAEALDKPILCIYRPGRALSAMLLGSTKIEYQAYSSINEMKELLNSFLYRRVL